MGRIPLKPKKSNVSFTIKIKNDIFDGVKRVLKRFIKDHGYDDYVFNITLVNKNDAKKYELISMADVDWKKINVYDGECIYFKADKRFEIYLFDKENLGYIDSNLFIILFHEMAHVKFFIKNFYEHPNERIVWLETIELYKKYCPKKHFNLESLVDIMVENLYSYKKYCMGAY